MDDEHDSCRKRCMSSTDQELSRRVVRGAWNRCFDTLRCAAACVNRVGATVNPGLLASEHTFAYACSSDLATNSSLVRRAVMRACQVVGADMLALPCPAHVRGPRQRANTERDAWCKHSVGGCFHVLVYPQAKVCGDGAPGMLVGSMNVWMCVMPAQVFLLSTSLAVSSHPPALVMTGEPLSSHGLSGGGGLDTLVMPATPVPSGYASFFRMHRPPLTAKYGCSLSNPASPCRPTPTRALMAGTFWYKAK